MKSVQSILALVVLFAASSLAAAQDAASLDCRQNPMDPSCLSPPAQDFTANELNRLRWLANEINDVKDKIYLAMVSDPSQVSGLFYELGQRQEDANEPAEARASYRNALTFDPTNAGAAKALVRYEGWLAKTVFDKPLATIMVFWVVLVAIVWLSGRKRFRSSLSSVATFYFGVGLVIWLVHIVGASGADAIAAETCDYPLLPMAHVQLIDDLLFWPVGIGRGVYEAGLPLTRYFVQTLCIT